VKPWEKYAETKSGPWQKYRQTPNAAPEQGAAVEGDQSPAGFFNRALVEGTMAVPDIVSAPIRHVIAPAELAVRNAIRSLQGLPEVSEDEASPEWDSLKNTAPSEFVSRGFRAIGSPVAEEGVDPETPGGKFAETMGSVPGILMGATPAIQMTAKQAGPMVSRISRDIANTFGRNPLRSVGFETAAGGAAGVGRVAAGEDATPAEQVIGELAGGLTFAGLTGLVTGSVDLAGKAPGVRLARETLARVLPFSKQGAFEAASKRMREQAADPEAAADLVIEGGLLTPAQRTGEPGLMALEKDVYEQSALLQKRYEDQLTEASRAIRDSIRLPGSVDDAQAFVGNRLERTVQALDARVRQAAVVANQRINALAPQRKAAESSAIVREEIDKALNAARAQERDLWDAVPEDDMIETKGLFGEFDAIRMSLPRAKRDIIPEKARRFLDRDSNERLGDLESVKEIQGLRSALLEDMRKARKDGEFNKARIIGQIEQALLDKLTEAGGEAAITEARQAHILGKIDLATRDEITATAEGMTALAEARDFSRILNERFTKGAVGRVLGQESREVDPRRTLKTTIGRGGEQGRVEGEQVLGATDSAVADLAAADYLKAEFAERAFRGGEYNKAAAEAFMRNNAEALEMFPDLKRQMGSANSAAALRDRVTKTAGARRDRLESRSVASRFIDAEVEDAIARVLSARNPTESAQELRRLVAKDKTGKALDGVQSAFVDHLMTQARTSDADEAGELVVSGRRFWNLLNEPKTKRALNAIMTGDQIKRLRQAAIQFRNLETSRRVSPTGAIMTDAPGKLIQFIAGTLGARAGARLGEGTSGASLRTASKTAGVFEKLAKQLSGDRAAMMIEDAILKDPQLFRALLTDMRDPDGIKKAMVRINAWLADIEERGEE